MMRADGRRSFAVLQKEVAVEALEQNATCGVLEQFSGFGEHLPPLAMWCFSTGLSVGPLQPVFCDITLHVHCF